MYKQKKIWSWKKPGFIVDFDFYGYNNKDIFPSKQKDMFGYVLVLGAKSKTPTMVLINNYGNVIFNIKDTKAAEREFLDAVMYFGLMD